MRVGINPQKRMNKIDLIYNHRIIIVVFIPSLEGYYKDVFEVFKLCLKSAISTINNKCAITIVNNASCYEIMNFINDKLQTKEIDSVIHHNENIGKMDALIGAARGCREPLITLSDVDILFKYGWQTAVENIFLSMNDVGSVSPIPVRKSMRYGTISTLQKILFKQIKLDFIPIEENFDDHNLYLKSINWDIETKKKLNWPVISQNGSKAILGSGHQIMTINRLILLTKTPLEPSLTLVGNNSEFLYCDQPIDLSGGIRLATYHNFAYHMGNKVEDWMLIIQDENDKKRKNNMPNIIDIPIKRFKSRELNKKIFLWKKKIILKLFNLIYSSKINL